MRVEAIAAWKNLVVEATKSPSICKGKGNRLEKTEKRLKLAKTFFFCEKQLLFIIDGKCSDESEKTAFSLLGS